MNFDLDLYHASVPILFVICVKKENSIQVCIRNILGLKIANLICVSTPYTTVPMQWFFSFSTKARIEAVGGDTFVETNLIHNKSFLPAGFSVAF